MNNNELQNIYGGASFSYSLLNAIVKGVTSLYDIGKRIGTYVIRYKTGKLCTVE